MATQFFEHQEAARRSTTLLVLLFVCAVIGIIALLYAVAVGLTAQPVVDAYGQTTSAELNWRQPQLLAQVTLGTLAVVLGGSLYKVAQLSSGGGAVVAQQLGGQLLTSDTRDRDGRKLLNVVEEMAIASGTPTPPVYLLDEEDGINAFAAGFTPSDAVIGVTRGCMRHLSREELQGVIAHEFSHILNGDMRINIRLMGFIHGILLLGIIGYFLLRSSMFAGGGRRGGRDNSGLIMLAAGIGLMIAGFVGTFFGNLIKASVSRQRECLADASAVQFTRNPVGLAGALKKIAGLDVGSALTSAAAPEASHMFFSRGLRNGLQSLFDTHPPIEERIARLDPSFQIDASAAKQSPSGSSATTAAPAAAMGLSSAQPPPAAALAIEPADTAIESIGAPTPAHLDHAQNLVRQWPATLTEACREPHGARGVFYALLIDQENPVQERQLERLDQFAEAGIAQETRRWLPIIHELGPAQRLPIVDLALPALRRLSRQQYQSFRENTQALVEADHRIELFEWTLQRILLAHLAPHFEKVRRPTRRKKLPSLAKETSLVLCVLARLGNSDEQAMHKAFQDGAAELKPIRLEWLSEDRCDLAALDRALNRLTRATPTTAQQILRAAAACVASDRVVAESEAEVIRALADSLDCPMPPLLSGQSLI